MKVKQKELTESRNIRFPIKLWIKLSETAERNGRTIAREIVHRLQKSIKQD